MEFKVGDKIKVKDGCSKLVKEKTYVVYSNNTGKLWARDEELEKESRVGCSCYDNWELVKEIFKVGDRVKALGSVSCLNMEGKIGTIKDINNSKSDTWYGIEFDESFDEGHNLDGSAEKGYGRWSNAEDFFELVTPKSKENKMDIDKIKSFDKDVLKTAQEEVLMERAERNKEEAKEVLREVLDRKDKAEAVVEDANKELKEVGADLKVFNKK